MNCCVWALAEVAGIPPDEMLDKLADWVERDGAVTMPEAAVAIMPTLGFRVASYGGVGPIDPAGWARWSARWFPGAALLLIVDGAASPGGHALIARNGLLLDNGHPAGLPGLDHPYAAARVRVALRVYDGAEVRRDADERRWPIVAGS